MHKKLSAFLVLCIACASSTRAIDNAHFYRARPWPKDPRLTEPLLFTIDFNIGSGSSEYSYNRDGNKAPLLNLYGPQRLQYLGKNMVLLDPVSNPFDAALATLAAAPLINDFAMLSLCSQFSLMEVYFEAIQNFVQGFFIHGYLPIRKFNLSTIHKEDISRTDGISQNLLDAWYTVRNNLDFICLRYGINPMPLSISDIGDFSLGIGWALNYEETEYIDYFDISMEFGIEFPTSDRLCGNRLFEISAGNGGHTAIYGLIDASLGLYDWFTVGIHLDAKGFDTIKQILPIKTARGNNGFYKLARTCAYNHRDPQGAASCYLKADHFVRGLSLVIGYTFDIAGHTTLTPSIPHAFDASIVNSDSMLQGWRMSTLQFFAEYDFSHDDAPIAPKIAIFYNHVLKGQAVFKTYYAGFGACLEVAW